MNNTENLKVLSQNLPSGRVPSADASSLSISYKVVALNTGRVGMLLPSLLERRNIFPCSVVLCDPVIFVNS